MWKSCFVSSEPASPPWNSSDEIEVSVRALAAASRKTGKAAYQRVLFSVANGHAQTYWPAALSLIPRLGELLAEGSDIARLHALEVLVNLGSWSSHTVAMSSARSRWIRVMG